MNQGLPGFFAPHHRAWLSPHLALGDESSGYYETSRLRDTLAGLVDGTLLTACAPRLTVGAVNVKTGRMRYFDSRDERIDLRHILASGALPPAFPAVRIGDELFWDGGIYSNTPVEAVFDDNPRRSSLVFAVQLWQGAGDAPQTMWQVSGRQKDIQFSSRVDSHVQRQAQIHQLRHIVRELTRRLPASSLARPEVREMTGYGCGTVMHLMRLVAPRLPDEDHTKDMDFNASRIRQRWQAGLADARRTLARQAWLEPVGPMDGLVVHDLDAEIPTPQEA
jgi:NTE family protein